MKVMKDSGVTWIGAIPKHWKLIRHKFIAKTMYGFPLDSNKFSDEGFPMIRIRDITSEDIETYYNGAFPKEYIIKKGDILLGMDGDFNIKVWNGVNAVLNQRCCSLQGGKTINKKFIYYAIQQELKVINALKHSTTVKHLLSDDIDNLIIPTPSLKEQQIIIDYLDEKCSEIDALYADIEEQIKILEEYKKSVIAEAVTKGLNPDVEMRDSGVEWVGEIPVNWSAKRNKLLFKEIIDVCDGTEGYDLLSVSEYYGVAKRAEKIAEDEFLTRAESLKGYKICQTDDVVMNIMLAWKSSLGVSSCTGIVSPAYCVYRAKQQIHGKYFHYLFRTKLYANLFKRFSTGIIESRLRLYSDKFLALYSHVPPLEEQNAIATYLDGKCSEIDAIISEKKQQLETLAEYKKSVIYEYVTGKKEVML